MKKGQHHSEASKLKMSKACLGHPNYWKGKHLREETKKRLSDARKKIVGWHHKSVWVGHTDNMGKRVELSRIAKRAD